MMQIYSLYKDRKIPKTLAITTELIVMRTGYFVEVTWNNRRSDLHNPAPDERLG